MRFLVAVALLWIGARTAIWESPWSEAATAALAPTAVAAGQTGQTLKALPPGPAEGADEPIQALLIAPLTPARPASTSGQSPALRNADPLPVSPALGASDEALIQRGRSAAGHNLLWMAAMRALPVPAVLSERMDGRPGNAFAPVGKPVLLTERWRFDGWVQLRRGAAARAASTQGPSLGGSQAGAVARYSLLPSAAIKPEGLVRAGFTPAQSGAPARSEAGIGLRITPFAGLPLVAQGEIRVVAQGGRVRAVPVVLVAGGVDDIVMPAGARLRAYGEAGWSGEDGGGPFADGQAALTRTIAGGERSTLDAGVGAWAGAQRGASRVDVGPVVAWQAPLAKGTARLQLDYRIRVAGAAEPASGPALTLSTSF